MIKYIGDLSREDAAILTCYASRAHSILEFGVGASTQIIAQVLPEDATFVSIDTEMKWIKQTRRYLERLGVADKAQLCDAATWTPADDQRFDLIFDDGYGPWRGEFAQRAWNWLTVGGTMLFHDTRRPQDVRNVLHLIAERFDEITVVHWNEAVDAVSSNITAVVKKKREGYVNWNVVEGRPQWAIGYGEVPESFWEE